jgi:hypothetical protein
MRTHVRMIGHGGASSTPNVDDGELEASMSRLPYSRAMAWPAAFRGGYLTLCHIAELPICR